MVNIVARREAELKQALIENCIKAGTTKDTDERFEAELTIMRLLDTLES